MKKITGRYLWNKVKRKNYKKGGKKNVQKRKKKTRKRTQTHNPFRC